MFDVERLPDVLPAAIFDVRLPLSHIPPEATAREVLNEAARKSGKAPPDFVNGVKYLRSSGAAGKLIVWAHSGKGRGSQRYMRELRDNDILVFDSQIHDTFSGAPPRPNQAMQRTPTLVRPTFQMTKPPHLRSTLAPR